MDKKELLLARKRHVAAMCLLNSIEDGLDPEEISQWMSSRLREELETLCADIYAAIEEHDGTE